MTPKYRYSIHVVLGVVGFLCVAWGVFLYQHRLDLREPLWQQGATQYGHHPVLFYYADDDFRPYLATITASFELWNSALGCNAVARTGDLMEADVIMRPLSGEPCGKDYDSDKAPAWTCYRPPGAVVEFRALDDVGLALEMFAHEIGHAAFGLADRNAGDIMSPLKQPEVGDPPPATLITPFLADAVRGRACR